MEWDEPEGSPMTLQTAVCLQAHQCEQEAMSYFQGRKQGENELLAQKMICEATDITRRKTNPAAFRPLRTHSHHKERQAWYPSPKTLLRGLYTNSASTFNPLINFSS